MSAARYARIAGTGSYLPDVVEKNEDFHKHEFLNTDGSAINHSNEKPSNHQIEPMNEYYE